MIQRLSVDLGDLETKSETLANDGKTPMFVAVDGQAAGIIAVADTVKEDSQEAIAALHQMGIEVVMITGDNRRTAEAIARQVGVDRVLAEVLPEDKAHNVHLLQAEGKKVAMVGDGINDAPALAAANLGIAMGAAGTDIAIETADIALMSDDLLKLPEAIRLSRATLNNIHQNVVIALVTVTFLLLGVLFGQVHMAGGMLIHEASVLIVILNGMRLLGQNSQRRETRLTPELNPAPL
jgi:Cd2+/Zn2+-exporting ATPase